MYVKPRVIMSDELAEGIFMASGDGTSGNCWSISVEGNQDWNGESHLFRVIGVHSDTVEHISTSVEVRIHFNNTIVSARGESDKFTCTPDGDSVVFTRTEHANAYKSGDSFNSQIWVSTGDEATSRALAVVSIDPPVCTHITNVQGGGADGN